MTRITKTAIAIFALLLASGCTLITDFDAPGDKYSLYENLPDTLGVTLSTVSNTGSLTMPFTEALPEADDAELLALLEDTTVSLNVANDEAVSYNLTEGTRVDGTPASAGEYALTMSEDRMSIGVSFYNEHSGTALHAGHTYTATIDVLDNDFFATESFAIDVTAN